MTFHAPNKVQRLWDEWNLRGAILFSLFLQVLMTLSAPSRKRTKNKLISIVLWSAYLLADWVAAFAVGLIVSLQGDNCNKSVVNKELAAFWAPFLLLHLGGPDTITAFSPEDNELWLRHLASLVFELGAVTYAFSQSTDSEFWIPAVLLIFAGTIKYAERTRALYLARSGNYRDFDGRLVPGIEREAKNIIDFEVVEIGMMLFKYFSLLILHSMFNEIDPSSAKYFFDRFITSEDAYRIMEVELNFMYDTLYTKMAAVHNKMGYIFRFICYFLTVISFRQFYFHQNKHKFHVIDIAITYTLLIGAVGLDLVSLLKLIFSDWTVASIKNTVAKSIICAICKRLPFNKRWHQSVSQLNLISCSLVERSLWFDKVTGFFGLERILDEMQYTQTIPVKDGLKHFIFEVLRSMSLSVDIDYFAFQPDRNFSVEEYDSLKEMLLARGNWILSKDLHRFSNHPSVIEWSVSKQVDYHESILMWHLATEVCYITDPDVASDCYREYSKILSDYMLYLLVMRPETLLESAAVIVAEGTFWATYQHVRLLSQQELEDNPTREFNTVEEKHKFVCDFILKKNVLYEQEWYRKDIRKGSMLEDARDLAWSLRKIDLKEKRWEMIGKVWVELLRFGAIHSTARSHAQLLSKGGEFITLVSLLNAHFGLGYQFLRSTKPSEKGKPLRDYINKDTSALHPSQPNFV